jgi:peptidoglycan/xylan/chitin deacetylase (PgdA/CDA1 family)
MKRLMNALTAFGLLLVMAIAALPAHAADANLIANPAVASTGSNGQPTNWTPNSWGTNNAALSYSTASGHGDSTSLGITMSSYTNGDASWIPDQSAVAAGQNYTFTDWYESSAPTELDAQYTDASGNVSYAYLATLASSASWNQADVSFNVPANVTKVSILHILYSAGSLQTDDFSLTQAVSVPPADGNLIANASFETANGSNPANWNQGGWGTNATQFSYGANAHTGTKSATVTMSSYTSGDAKWYANPVAVTSGQSYTYSDWYESNVATQVVAAYIDGSGNYTYSDLPGAAAASAWAQYSAAFVVPAGTAKVVVYHLLGAVGSLTIDDVDLTAATSAPPNGNLVPNNSVETADPNNQKVPLDWQSDSWGSNNASFSYLATGAHTGSRAVQVSISNYSDGDGKWYFDPVAVTPDTQYRFSDYFKATVATQVMVAFTMSDGSMNYQLIGQPDAAAGWTQFSTSFTAPQGAESMTIFHLLQSVGTLTVDDENLQTYMPAGFNGPLVTLTFDDGYANEYTQGLPLLQKYNFVSTQFIITDLVNTNGYMTNAQLKAMYQAGNEIGSHTVTHDDMLDETPQQWTTELSQSKSQLQNWTGATVTDMAYPYGLYGSALIQQVAKYYTGARSVDNGLNSKDNLSAYTVKVQNVFDNTTTAQITDWLNQAKATNTWLVLVYHSVDPDVNNPVDEGIYNVTPTQLDSQLSAIKASGLPVETMQQALQQLTAQL